MNFLFTLDPLYWMLIGPALLLAVGAQLLISEATRRYSRVSVTSGYSGAETARAILDSNGLYNVRVEPVPGRLSDHYDPRTKTLRLSPDVFAGRSVTAVGIAAHEAGHALQDARGYLPLQLRSLAVPAAGFGSFLAMPLLMMGLLFHSTGMMTLGIVFFSLVVLFQVITLPVEFDASARARRQLAAAGIVRNPQEADGVGRVLNAAALTYVAAAVSAMAELAYFVLRSGLLSSDDA